jgi:hypothetical protein
MKVFILIILAFCVAPLAQTVASGQTIVTASQVNGTWNNKRGAFKVRALGNQKLRVEFSGFYEYVSQAGPMVNTGEGKGIAFIEGDTAIFKPDGAEEECRITMKFIGGKLVVTQDGVCGFGLNVTAAGTYRKGSRNSSSSRKKPSRFISSTSWKSSGPMIARRQSRCGATRNHLIVSGAVHLIRCDTTKVV